MTLNERANSGRRAAIGGWGTLLVILSCDFVITLDFFIVNLSVPAIRDSLATTDAAVQLVIAGYALAYAAGLITWGRLGDIHGRRRMFLLGTALFTVASAACGLAPSAGALIGARVVQGITAALMAPQMLAILGTVYSGAARTRAFSFIMLGKGLAAVFGQLLGGALIGIDAAGLGWRLCFLINVPVGIVSLAMAPRVVPESRGTGRTGLDLPGAAYVSAGLVIVVLTLVTGNEAGWPVWSWAAFAAAAGLLWAFVTRQRRLTAAGGSPLMHTSLFRNRSFSVGVTLVTVYYAGVGAFFLVLAMFLEDAADLSALRAGLLSSAIGAGFFAVTVPAQAHAHRLGRHMISLGGVTLAAGWGLLGLTVAGTGTGKVAALIPALVVCGAGMGLVMAPMTATVVSHVDSGYAGAASGVLTTAIQVGGALGVAFVGLIYGGADEGARGLGFSAIYLVGVAVTVAALAQLLEGARHGKDVRGGPAAAHADHAVAGGH